MRTYYLQDMMAAYLEAAYFTDGEVIPRKFKSYRAAQLFITKALTL